MKSWVIGKDSDAGRDWGQEEKGMTEDEMAGWHHWLDGRESEWIPGVGDGQGGQACRDSWGSKESDKTEQLNWTELKVKKQDLTPGSWGANERDEFSEPWDSHLPVCRMLNSLTWYLIFDIQTACFHCYKIIHCWSLPPVSLQQFSQSYWDAVSWAQSPKHSDQIK